jgi:DtxR family Mn-dependent transcriptional regulator
VHEEAERLEHAVSDKLIDRMAGALGDPHYDPHGAPIPTATGEIEEAELVTLADAAVGAELVLRQVGDENPARLRYLAEQGLTPGTRMTVVERQPFNGPITVRVGIETRVVGQELALLLLCRPTNGD